MCLAVGVVTEAFVFSNPCVAPPPCSCNERMIHCSNFGLSQVPNFTILYAPGYLYRNKVHVELYNNRLTSIRANAFKNLAMTSTMNITIWLQNNSIHNIDDEAFNRIEHVVVSLNIANNNLTSLPRALGRLTKLGELNLLNNPLITLDQTVMTNIGQTLNTFAFDCQLFSTYPTELRFLQTLKHLTISNIPFYRLPSNAFDGFETSLLDLDMPNSNLEKLPDALCRLVNLSSLTVNSSRSLNKYGSIIFEQCYNQNVIHIKTLKLLDNNLTKFPDVFTYLPNLEVLNLDHNQLSLLEIPINMYNASFKIRELYLRFNNFIRIPPSVNSFPDLEKLELQYNQITSIHDYDLFRLSKLRQIGMDINPVTYVSPNAFKGNLELSWIGLAGAKLTQVPRGVVSLPKLNIIFLHGNTITCGCIEMHYLKTWNVSSIVIGGSCHITGEPLTRYITGDLRLCRYP